MLVDISVKLPLPCYSGRDNRAAGWSLNLLGENAIHFTRFRLRFKHLIDNRALGHKRTSFRDWPEAEHKRLLVRLWLRDRGSRAYNG